MKIRWKTKVLEQSKDTQAIIAQFNMIVTAKEMTVCNIIVLAITLPMRCVWTMAAALSA